MTDVTKPTFSEKLEEQRIDIQQTHADSMKNFREGCLVLVGMLIVCVTLVGIFLAISDSDMTDALQECGYIKVGKGDGVLPDSVRTLENASVDACRTQVFEFYKGKPS